MENGSIDNVLEEGLGIDDVSKEIMRSLVIVGGDSMGTEGRRNGDISGSENRLTGSGLNLVDAEGMVGLECLVVLGALVDSEDDIADDSKELI